MNWRVLNEYYTQRPTKEFMKKVDYAAFAEESKTPATTARYNYLMDAIKQLDDNQRNVLFAMENFGLSAVDVANKVQCTPEHIQHIRRSALQKLRDIKVNETRALCQPLSDLKTAGLDLPVELVQLLGYKGYGYLSQLLAVKNAYDLLEVSTVTEQTIHEIIRVVNNTGIPICQDWAKRMTHTLALGKTSADKFEEAVVRSVFWHHRRGYGALREGSVLRTISYFVPDQYINNILNAYKDYAPRYGVYPKELTQESIDILRAILDPEIVFEPKGFSNAISSLGLSRIVVACLEKYNITEISTLMNYRYADELLALKDISGSRLHTICDAMALEPQEARKAWAIMMLKSYDAYKELQEQLKNDERTRQSQERTTATATAKAQEKELKRLQAEEKQKRLASLPYESLRRFELDNRLLRLLKKIGIVSRKKLLEVKSSQTLLSIKGFKLGDMNELLCALYESDDPICKRWSIDISDDYREEQRKAEQKEQALKALREKENAKRKAARANYPVNLDNKEKKG